MHRFDGAVVGGGANLQCEISMQVMFYERQSQILTLDDFDPWSNAVKKWTQWCQDKRDDTTVAGKRRRMFEEHDLRLSQGIERHVSNRSSLPPMGVLIENEDPIPVTVASLKV